MSVDSSQINFNPSWMQPTPLKGERVNGIPFSSEDEPNQEILMDPVFANHRYGREDILALMVKDVKPPDGLNRCLFFVKNAQTPIILQSLNETELRLQQNINSSKALSALKLQDRHIVNGSDVSVSASSNSKWVVAGGSRSFHSHNKPASNRWNTLGSPSANGSDTASGYRNPRVSGTQSFSRSTGAGLRLNDQRSGTSNRYRIPSTSNDSGNLSETQSPSTSTTGGAGAWSKVGASKGLKLGDSARLLLGDSGGGKEAHATGHKNVTEKSNTSYPNEVVSEKKESANNASAIGLSKPSSPSKVIMTERDKWFYLDPNGVQRGPYESKQMQSWFDNGYFGSSLRICRVGNKSFYTLGELFHENGAVTPFVSKPFNLSSEIGDESKSLQKNSPDVVDSSARHNSPKVVSQPKNAWSNISAKTTYLNNQFLSKVKDVVKPAYSSQQDLEFQKILMEKQRLIEEEQKKLREKEEHLLKEERDRLAKEQLIREKEIELQRKQDELQRIAKEKEEELEMKRQQVTEFERQRREALEKMEEKLRNEQLQQLKQKEEERLRLEAEAHRRLEAHKLMLEAEERRKFEAQRLLLEAEQRRREEEEANIRAAYEEARRLQEQAAVMKADKEQRARLLDEREKALQREREKVQYEAELKQKKQEEKAAPGKLLREKKEEEQRQQQEILRRRQLEEELSKIAIAAILNESPPPTKNKASAAPWVTVSTKTGGKKENPSQSASSESRGKTLLEIQKEEEEALCEKLKQQQELLEAHSKSAQSEPVWSKSASTKSSWGTLVPSSGGTIRSWNAVPVTQATPIPKAPTKEQPNQKKNQKKTQQKVTVKGLGEKSKQPDAFTVWIIKRVRELNSSVDADVFASFIEGVDSPNEAEDYMIGYLGESKAVKDFHRDFLNKRIELRPRVQPTAKDDLSGPAAAANDVYSSTSVTSGNHSSNNDAQTSGNNNGGKKKKKGKTQKVLDPAILGFRAAGDPNRINAGEIDTAPPVPTNRKR